MVNSLKSPVNGPENRVTKVVLGGTAISYNARVLYPSAYTVDNLRIYGLDQLRLLGLDYTPAEYTGTPDPSSQLVLSPTYLPGGFLPRSSIDVAVTVVSLVFAGVPIVGVIVQGTFYEGPTYRGIPWLFGAARTVLTVHVTLGGSYTYDEAIDSTPGDILYVDYYTGEVLLSTEITGAATYTQGQYDSAISSYDSQIVNAPDNNARNKLQIKKSLVSSVFSSSLASQYRQSLADMTAFNNATAAAYTAALSALSATITSTDVVGLVLSGGIMDASISPVPFLVLPKEETPSNLIGTPWYLTGGNLSLGTKKVRFFFGPPTSTDKTALYINSSTGVWTPGEDSSGEYSPVTKIYDRIVNPPENSVAYVDYVKNESTGAWVVGTPSRALTTAERSSVAVYVYLLPPKMPDYIVEAEDRVLSVCSELQGMVKLLGVSAGTIGISPAQRQQLYADLSLVLAKYEEYAQNHLAAYNWQRLAVYWRRWTSLCPLDGVLDLIAQNVGSLESAYSEPVSYVVYTQINNEGYAGFYNALPSSVGARMQEWLADEGHQNVSEVLYRMPLTRVNQFDCVARIPTSVRRVVLGYPYADTYVDIPPVDDQFIVFPHSVFGNFGDSVRDVSIKCTGIGSASSNTYYIQYDLELTYDVSPGEPSTITILLALTASNPIVWAEPTTVTKSRVVTIESGVYYDSFTQSMHSSKPDLSTIMLMSGIGYGQISSMFAGPADGGSESVLVNAVGAYVSGFGPRFVHFSLRGGASASIDDLLPTVKASIEDVHIVKDAGSVESLWLYAHRKMYLEKDGAAGSTVRVTKSNLRADVASSVVLEDTEYPQDPTPILQEYVSRVADLEASKKGTGF